MQGISNKLISSRRTAYFSKIKMGLALLLGLIFNFPAFGFSTIEINEGVLPATTGGNNTFTQILFASPFAPGTIPNVFTMTTEDGDDPCTIRVTDVNHLGFLAACLEPSNEDGNHPGMMFDYIAVADGGVTVPLAGGGGNVEFRSECTTTDIQQYGNRCDNCSGARDYTPIAFTPNFSAAPAFIAQLQTTENTLPSGDPSFLDIAVQTGSLNNAGVNIAIEQMEAGLGPLAEEERICYLAVERNGCESLDFSSLGGSSTPIPFNAVHGSNVDGHDNACTSGEGASFANGCFANTPIAVAEKNSRVGGDGGMVRRCSVSNSEIILTFDEDQISNNERSHLDEFVSVMAFGGAVTTPVTLSQAKVSLMGRRVLFEWQTSAESFHLGFHLWGEQDGQWVQLNKSLISQSLVNADGIKDYQHTLRLTREQRDTITNFGISSLDNGGFEEFYGPFNSGQAYGEEASIEPIDWSETRAEFNQAMEARGYSLKNGKWKKLGRRAAQRLADRELGIEQASLQFMVEHAGIHQLSFADIDPIAPHWQNTPTSDISLSLNGQPLPLHIDSEDDLFNDGDTLTFVGLLPSGGDEIYLDHYHYQLQIDASKALRANVVDNSTENHEYSIIGSQNIALSEEKQYSALLNNGNPWYDTKIVSIGNPASEVFTFELPNEIAPTQESQVNISLFGAIDFPGDANEQADHIVQARINGHSMEEIRFDGFSEKLVSLNIPSNVLTSGLNTLTLTLPGNTGYEADIVLVDEILISTPIELTNKSHYDFEEYGDAQGYELALVAEPSNRVQVFAYRTDGALSTIEPIDNSASSQSSASLVRFNAVESIASSNPAKAIRYAATGDGWFKPSNLQLVTHQNLHSEASEYLVVSHPSFMGDELSAFVESKVDSGLDTAVVNWLDIVSTYGFGNNTPAALKNFLKFANSDANTTRFVLLVGGHTYDYRNLLQSNSVSFIPADYQQVSIFGHTPTDNSYADLDGDDRPDLAIGRWPVRSIDDLQKIIQKTSDWQTKIDQTQYQDALLIAQADDSLGLSFDKQSFGRSALPLSQLDHFNNIENLSMQQLIESEIEDPISEARATIANRINSGLDLLSYSGHASTSAWGSPGLVNTDFIQSLENQGNPIIVMPQACYTTYYESLNINTLAHQWLFAGNSGAVAIHGASVLGEYRENGIFAERFLKQSKNYSSIGEAIMAAKRELTSDNEMLSNWALLGDPSLPLH